ncbi:MAG: hypothetical protein HYS09_06395 [Chloroflexi bacterium]|nr:hypothetical protein [Chloroflexota bacterium]
MREEDVCLELFLDWLAAAHGRRFQVQERTYAEPFGLSAAASDGHYALAVEVRRLVDPGENEVWQAYRQQLQQDVAVGLKGGYALWLPPGADLPGGGRESMEFAQRVRDAAFSLQPGERGFVPLPVTLYLRKVREEGALVSVAGPLDAYWAKMSEHVHGSYDLDSTRLHRLPEDEEHRRELLDRIVSAAGQVENVGQWAELETVDAWTLQHLAIDEHGVLIVGVPPDAARDMGIAVRRNFRRALAEAGPALAGRECDLRALVVLGYYPYIDQEGATTALRGYDPTLYSALDFVCLVTDGRAKALVESPAYVLPWAKKP